MNNWHKMENSLKQLDEYLEKIGRSELVTEQQNDTIECDNLSEVTVHWGELEKSKEIRVKKEKSNTIVENDKSSSLIKSNEKSIKFTRDFTPYLHNRNNSYTESFSANTDNDQVSVPSDTAETDEIPGSNFIDSVKTESLHFEESEKAVNELAEIGLNKQNLQNYATLGTLTTNTGNINHKTDGLVHPVALKKSVTAFRKPEPIVQPQSRGQVTTLLDISSITELKRLWVKNGNVDKRVNVAASKQISNKRNLRVTKETCNAMKRQRPLGNGDVQNKIVNKIKTNTKLPKTSRSAEGDCDRDKFVNDNAASYQTKHCTVKLVRVENLPIFENLKIDLFCPKNCIHSKLENSMPEKIEGKSLIKNAEQKKQILKKIIAISNRKNKNLKRKTKTMLASPKQIFGISKKNAKQKDKPCALETTVKDICSKRLMVRIENMKDQQNCEEVKNIAEQFDMPEDIDGEPYKVIKSENDEIVYSGDDIGDDDLYNDDDDYIPSDDDKDDDYHPRKKLKKSKNKTRSTNLVQDNILVKSEFEHFSSDTKSKRVKGTRIGRPPVLGHFECKLCDFTANEKNLVTKHHFKTHRQQIIKCEPCSKIFKSMNRFLEHNAYYHDGGKPFKCGHEGCPYASKNPTDLSRHQAKHETELKHVCSICGWRTKWRRNMKHHHVMKHCDERNYHCTICEFSAKRKYDLKYHLYRHTENKPIQCLTCGFRVKTNFELRSHMLVHTNEKPFKCTFPGCSSRTKTKSDLTKHMRVHLTERKFKCHICSKGYKDQVALNKHLRGIHVEGRKFNCDICGKTFKNRYALKKHVFLHSGFKPYDCSVCGWKFTTRSNLDKHMVTHDTKGRPYLCPLCPYAAKISDHLLAHIGSFHGDKYAYFCELCSKPFKRYMQLKLHYERMHSKEEVENLKKPGNGDLALLKIQIKLELEENEAGIKRKRKISSKSKAVSETDVKTETLDAEYGDTASNVNEDLQDVRLNEDTGLIEVVKKKKLNTTTSEGKEECHKEDGRNNVENLEQDNELENVYRVENEVREVIDSVIETDGNNCQKQENETDVKDDEKRAENILITKDERRTVAFCNNLRLPLATRGFKFNYDKTGKKPAKSWFMDTSLMDKKTAERHKKYGRRVGLLPPIPKGHPPKGCKRLKKFIDKRKKQLSEKIKKEKRTNDVGLVMRRNTPRSKKFPDKYTEFETTEDEMLSEAESQEKIPKCSSYSVDTIKEITGKSHSSNVQQTKKESTPEKQNTSIKRKDVKEKIVTSCKEKLSTKTIPKTKKLLPSTEKNNGGKTEILNIRKTSVLDKTENDCLVKEVNENSIGITEEKTLSHCGYNRPTVSEVDDKVTDKAEDGVKADTKSVPVTVTKFGKEAKNVRVQNEDKRKRMKSTVQLRLKHLLQCKKDELENVSKSDNHSKNKEYNLGKKLLKDNEGMDVSTVYPASKPLHVPVKDTQLVMVYPTRIVQNTGMGVISSVNDGTASSVPDHSTDLERIEIKEDLDYTFEEVSDGGTNVDKGGNSDKDIMQLDYLALIKQEPADLEC